MAQSPQLIMVRPALDGLPPLELPTGYRVRTFQPGDAQNWSRILAASFERPAENFSFDRIMRAHPAFRPERVFFAVCGSEAVATASAYRRAETDPKAGYIHYVGTVPGHRGKKLGFWVSLAALGRMAQEGLRRAWLHTDDFRLAAIKTYLNLGFRPRVGHENQRERWAKVFEALGCRELTDRFAEVLNGPVWQPPELPQDEFDYPALVAARRRWHPARLPGRPGLPEWDAFADESLYKASALGTAGASISTVAAGEDRSFALRFRVGPAGMQAGTEVTFHAPGQRALGQAPQTRDPAAAGYVEVAGPAGAEVGAHGLGFRLESGTLGAGAEVRLTLGREGGFRWTPLAGAKRLKVIVNVGGGEPLMRLPEPVVVRVLPLPPDHIDVFLPGTAGEGENVSAVVTVRDRFDNRVPLSGTVSLAGAGADPVTGQLCSGYGTVSVGPVKGAALRVSASADCVPQRAFPSNSCVAGLPRNLYFGDMHVHDFTCPAEGCSAEVYRWAIEDKRLDFMSLAVQNHAHLDNEKWVINKHFAEAFLDEGRFVTFPAFEWQHSHFGDKVVHYLGGDQPYLPVDERRYAHPAALYEAVRGSDAFIISHHPGYALDLHVPGTDWDAMETDVDRLVEIWSMHGSSEGYDPDDRPLVGTRREQGALAGLRAGKRFGFVAGSDTHSGRPGGSAKEPRPYWGGLCGVWAEELTRRSLFEAFLARRTYALTGARIVLRFSVNDACMGSEIEATGVRALHARVWAVAPVASVELMKDGHVLHSESPGREECGVEFEDRDETPAFYHCRVTQCDGHLAVCSPVWVG